MAWYITEDRISEPDEKSRVGYGEEHLRIPVEAVVLGYESPKLPDDMKTVPFLMYDDDGNLYYAGWLHDDDECLNQQAALRWGESDAGCTVIKVLRKSVFTQEIG